MEIHYPVFKIGIYRPQQEEGIVFLLWHTTEDGVDNFNLKIVDDTNIDKPSLAQRRLQLLKLGEPVKKISKAVFFLGDLIKLADSRTWFIDSNGIVFKYTKTKFIKLQFKKIKAIIQIKTGGAIIELEGIHTRFKTLYTPSNTVRYGGVLVDSMGYILYGLYTEKLKDTVRKI